MLVTSDCTTKMYGVHQKARSRASTGMIYFSFPFSSTRQLTTYKKYCSANSFQTPVAFLLVIEAFYVQHDNDRLPCMPV